MSTRESEPSRRPAVGLVRHPPDASELARSQARVRLAVTAWLRDLTLVETFELDDALPDGDDTLDRLVETASATGIRIVLTSGQVDCPWVEAALIWLGLCAVPVERLEEAPVPRRGSLPVPRQLLAARR